MKCDRCKKELLYCDESLDSDYWGTLCAHCAVLSLNDADEENEKLKKRVKELEEADRWRKYPDEKPEEDGVYLIKIKDIGSMPSPYLLYWASGDWTKYGVFVDYWKPTGKLPESKIAPEQKKKPRLFGSPESFGDGVSWAYLGDNPTEIAQIIKNTFESGVMDQLEEKEWVIQVRFMTDEEVKKLPTL